MMETDIDFNEFAKVLFSTDEGEVNLSLHTLANEQPTSTTVYDLHEFYVNLILSGMKILNIDFNQVSLEEMIDKMRPYFRRMHVKVTMEKITEDANEHVGVVNRYLTFVPDMNDETGEISYKLARNLIHTMVQNIKDVTSIYYDAGVCFVISFEYQY